MRKYLLFTLCGLLFVPAATAAGTYMGAGGYQSPQRYYQQGNAGGYYQPQNVGTSGYGYGGGNYYQQPQQGGRQYGGQQPQQQPQQQYSSYQNNQYDWNNNQQSRNSGQGSRSAGQSGNFSIDAALSRQYAQWNFDMGGIGSILNYGDIAWNVLDVRGKYKMDDWIIDGGFVYGMQSGESWMTDDDITAGGMIEPDILGSGFDQSTKVLSIGKSSGGTMTGLNVGVGMANKFGYGRIKITPSIGYRIFTHKLTTSDSHGLSVVGLGCYDLGAGEYYCPATIWFDDGGDVSMTGPGYEDNGDPVMWWKIPSDVVSPGDTYAFRQKGATHIYEVSWNGPYIAADFNLDIDETNFVSGRVELGFPAYEAKGQQPYRYDWAADPINDTKPMFGATHLGLIAGWTQMINKDWGFTVGVTYDYYSVAGADATTKLNPEYYNQLLQGIYYAENSYHANGWTWNDFMAEDETALAVKELESMGWKLSAPGEVNSFYRSIGIRIGVAGKF